MKHLANKSSPKSNEIREHYWEMLQNPILFSPVYGRAEIYQGLPYYCDGENLFVVGYSIDDSEIEIDKRISGVVSLARDRWRDRLQSIQFWGPVRPNDFIVPNDFIRTLELKPNHSNRDVILFLDDASLKRVRSGRDIRRAFRNGLSVEINYSKATTAEHSKIFEKFFQTHTDIERDDLSYFTPHLGNSFMGLLNIGGATTGVIGFFQ